MGFIIIYEIKILKGSHSNINFHSGKLTNRYPTYKSNSQHCLLLTWGVTGSAEADEKLGLISVIGSVQGHRLFQNLITCQWGSVRDGLEIS